MEILFDETYASDDSKQVSRNIWYGYADIYVDGEYGKDIRLTESLMGNLREIIKRDLSKNSTLPPTETNWYFYGSAVTQDAIGDNIRPAIMVREQSGQFISNFNISDRDFAVSIDDVLLFKADFEKRLASH